LNHATVWLLGLADLHFGYGRSGSLLLAAAALTRTEMVSTAEPTGLKTRGIDLHSLNVP
jgi:hypothetical protein